MSRNRDLSLKFRLFASWLGIWVSVLFGTAEFLLLFRIQAWGRDFRVWTLGFGGWEGLAQNCGKQVCRRWSSKTLFGDVTFCFFLKNSVGIVSGGSCQIDLKLGFRGLGKRVVGRQSTVHQSGKALPSSLESPCPYTSPQPTALVRIEHQRPLLTGSPSKLNTNKPWSLLRT